MKQMFLDIQKIAKRINAQTTCSTRNVKGSPLDRRKMI
jgi:hypothetical protein